MTSGIPNLAVSAAITRSWPLIIARPPPRHHPLTAPPVGLAIAHVVEITPRRVRIAGAHGDDTADFVIIGERAKNTGELAEQSDAERVFLLRAVEGQPGDTFGFIGVC